MYLSRMLLPLNKDHLNISNIIDIQLTAFFEKGNLVTLQRAFSSAESGKEMFFTPRNLYTKMWILLVTFPPSSATYAFPCHLLDQTHPLLHQSFFGRNHIHLCLCLKIRKQKKIIVRCQHLAQVQHQTLISEVLSTYQVGCLHLNI